MLMRNRHFLTSYVACQTIVLYNTQTYFSSQSNRTASNRSAERSRFEGTAGDDLAQGSAERMLLGYSGSGQAES